jgi:LPXTG-motif cell wall-anchored protein
LLGASTDNFYGRGVLAIENTSQQAVTLAMSVGILFPPVTTGEQAMAGYATNVQVSNPQAAQAPQQLPNTGGESTLLVLPLGGLLLIGAGSVLRLTHRAR